MSVTVQSIVNQVAWDILEDVVDGPGPSLGLVTVQEILDDLGIVLMDFLRKTGIEWTIFTQQLVASVSQYTVPNQMPEVYYVFQNAYIIDRINFYSTYLRGQWTRNPGMSKAYHEDGLPIKTIELVPPPNWNGIGFIPTVGPPPPFGTFDSPGGTTAPFQPGNRNLTMVGSAIPTQEVWGIDDTLAGIPDSATPYLVFGILQKIFSADGESRDIQRANYCQKRYEEGISLYRSVLLSTMEDSQEAR